MKGEGGQDHLGGLERAVRILTEGEGGKAT